MLWHELAGDGPPVLLLHEGICDSRVWKPQWRTFPRAHRTVRCLERPEEFDRLVLAFLDEE